MKTRTRRRALLAALLTGALVAPASAAVIYTPPIPLLDEELGANLPRAECSILSVADQPRRVRIETRCRSGWRQVQEATIAPGHVGVGGTLCSPGDSFTCEFRVDGPARDFRAAACANQVAVGCYLAADAR